MPSSSQSRDPRGKLREVTTRWLATVRLHGQRPSREVTRVPDRRAAHLPFAGYERRVYAALLVRGDERPFASPTRPHVSAIA